MFVPQCTKFIILSACLYIKGQKAATIETNDKSLDISYSPLHPEGIALIQKAEEYLNKQINSDINKPTLAQNPKKYLSKVIYHLAISHYNKKLQAYANGKQKLHGINLNNQGKDRWFGFDISIQSILSLPGGEYILRSLISSHVIPHLKKGDKLLNVNLPKSVESLFPKELILKPRRYPIPSALIKKNKL